jgi:hypothetical protein
MIVDLLLLSFYIPNITLKVQKNIKAFDLIIKYFSIFAPLLNNNGIMREALLPSFYKYYDI